ncbi:hypothetical protein AAFF_G00106880 [Aldrovandia affinis]|uniref:Uncharacterized protein n=1 Tax=Aldrovandia affinis TaxID=143900 RepID=A0AAD7T451_9TELE|nr:hypothetical protein AAFF_G00106880 [Aldrovandia affinis]
MQTALAGGDPRDTGAITPSGQIKLTFIGRLAQRTLCWPGTRRSRLLVSGPAYQPPRRLLSHRVPPEPLVQGLGWESR